MSQRNSEHGVRRSYQTVPICDDCWMAETGDREPIRLRKEVSEACAFCGQITKSGIYVRRKPNGQ